MQEIITKFTAKDDKLACAIADRAVIQEGCHIAAD